MPVRLYYMLFYVMNPHYSPTQDRFSFGAIRLDQCRTACALERFRFQNHRYPDRLEELLPDFLPTISHEIFSLEALCYRVDPAPGRFTLYSRALNGRDDGGIITNSPAVPKRTKGIISSIREPDWVWTYPDSPR